MTIPEYPTFTKLSIAHKEAFTNITAKYPPYSDFNFTSLFSWDTENATLICRLNDNLVIQLSDYITGKPVYSMLGTNSVDESFMTLLEITPSLKLVPESTVASLKQYDNFVVTKDRDSYDYIFSIPEHASLLGKQHKGRRNKLHRLDRNYAARIEVAPIVFSDPDSHRKIEAIFQEWAAGKNRTDDETSTERLAVQRAVAHAQELGIEGLFLLLDGACIGFSIVEVLSEDFAIYHFQKTFVDHQNLDAFLTNAQALSLSEKGINLINWEQDLGIEGLRHLKTSYFPYDFLRKFEVKRLS